MRRSLVIGCFLLLAILAQATTKSEYENLNPNQVISQFRAEAVYRNAVGQAIGARFRHVPSGFVLDLITIQSLPQAFVWVNSVPPTDKGEPHTCEHLLLGKGTVGRYVASLENMSLAQSSAFTMQLQTCYHYNTAAGADVFFKLFQEQMNAMLHPNFSDEEIRREVCNIGYSVDPSDSTLRLEEKGTVYNEMVSSFESPYGNVYYEIDRLVYGTDHPLSRSSGGFPAAIRTATPEDLWRFQKGAYHLSNMGAIVSVPKEITVAECLKQFTSIFAVVEPGAKVEEDPATLQSRLPFPMPAEMGAVKLNSFPSQKADDPGPLVFAWPATRELDPREQALLEMLVSNLAVDQTSILYRDLIDSKNRKLDCGATSVGGWVSSDKGFPVYVSLDNVKKEWLTVQRIDSIRSLILSEIAAIAAYPDGSAELKAFNERVKARMIERKRQERVALNTPPRFGYRGTGSDWLARVQRATRLGGFERSLVFEPEYAFVDSVLARPRNIWKEFISEWHLSEIPYASAGLADPEALAKSEKDRAERIARFTDGLKRKYFVTTDEEALRRFKQEYDAQTAVIDNEAKSIPMPPFVDKPPMTLDDQLAYSVEKLPGGGDLVVSTFDNMTGGTVGLAFRLDAIPDSLLSYIPALPTLLTSVGVIKDGKPMSYIEVREAQRNDILGLNAGFSVNHRTQRAELVARASGSDSLETVKALEWLNTSLTSPDLRSENLPRIRDAIDQTWAGTRNRMRGSVESWVDSPVNAYWRQTNRLLLSADCFLTQAHALWRLRWMLKDGASLASTKEFADFMHELGVRGNAVTKADLSKMLDAVGDASASPEPSVSGDDLGMRVSAFSADAKIAIKDAVADLRLLVPELPEATLSKDWTYLCNEVAVDYAMPAEQALSDVRAALQSLLKQDNARGYIVAGTPLQQVAKPRLLRLVKGLDASKATRFTYALTPVIFDHLKERYSSVDRPLYAGLVYENTRQGVFYNTASCASLLDSSDDALLNFLAARLYGGGGANSMFMKTWGAGLAYSNGLRSNEMNGRIIYYAERCPDLTQTMQFVVNELKNAPEDNSLADYAVAQAFAANRAGNNYEARGEAMANDLADGLTPDAVTRFRKKIMALRSGDMFAQQLNTRMETVYGLLLPGYGPGAKESVDKADARYFIVGPESQFQSYEKYLKNVEGDMSVFRLYPRDFWITNPAQKNF